MLKVTASQLNEINPILQKYKDVLYSDQGDELIKYSLNLKTGELTSIFHEIIGKKVEHFIVNPNLDNKMLKIIEDGNPTGLQDIIKNNNIPENTIPIRLDSDIKYKILHEHLAQLQSKLNDKVPPKIVDT